MKKLKEDGLMEDVSMVPLNIFTPGLYVRALYMPAGSIWVSKVHKEKHPYFVIPTWRTGSRLT